MCSLILRSAKPEDLPVLARLFRDTVRQINRRDYSARQISAWSGRWRSLLERRDFFDELHTLVAVQDGAVVGYGNITAGGYLDHLYVHKDLQGQGVATALCDALETYALAQGAQILEVHASITARPFFEHRGYRVMEEQTVQVDGVEMNNFRMQKVSDSKMPGA